MSKAFMKSIYTTSSDPPSSICVYSSNTFSNCSVVECPPINPNCLGLNSLFIFIWIRILSLTNDSSTLHTMLARRTSWSVVARLFSRLFLEYCCYVSDLLILAVMYLSEVLGCI